MAVIDSGRGLEWDGNLEDLMRVLGDAAMSARIEALRPGSGQAFGSVEVVAGGVSDALAGDRRGDDAVTYLQRIPGLRFRVTPAIPDANSGALTPPVPTEGSLAERPVASLMRYCEEFVLTCALELERAGEQARVSYRRGEITRTLVDGSEAADRLADVMAWTEGTWRISLPQLVLPRPQKPTSAPAPGAGGGTLFGYPAAVIPPPTASAVLPAGLASPPTASVRAPSGAESAPPTASAIPPAPLAARTEASYGASATPGGLATTHPPTLSAHSEPLPRPPAARIDSGAPPVVRIEPTPKIEPPAALKSESAPSPAKIEPAVPPTTMRPHSYLSAESPPPRPMVSHPSAADVPSPALPPPSFSSAPTHRLPADLMQAPPPAATANALAASTAAAKAAAMTGERTRRPQRGFLGLPLVVHMFIGALVGAGIVASYWAYLRFGGTIRLH